MGGCGQTLRQFILMTGIARDQRKHEIVRAAHHPAFANFGPCGHFTFKGREHGIVLAVEAYEGQELHFESE